MSRMMIAHTGGYRQVVSVCCRRPGQRLSRPRYVRLISKEKKFGDWRTSVWVLCDSRDPLFFPFLGSFLGLSVSADSTLGENLLWLVGNAPSLLRVLEDGEES